MPTMLSRGQVVTHRDFTSSERASPSFQGVVFEPILTDNFFLVRWTSLPRRYDICPIFTWGYFYNRGQTRLWAKQLNKSHLDNLFVTVEKQENLILLPVIL